MIATLSMRTGFPRGSIWAGVLGGICLIGALGLAGWTYVNIRATVTTALSPEALAAYRAGGPGKNFVTPRGVPDYMTHEDEPIAGSALPFEKAIIQR